LQTTFARAQKIKLGLSLVTMVDPAPSNDESSSAACSQGASQPSVPASNVSPFVTQTGVLKSLNKALADLQQPDDTTTPHFELQKRLPNGSTRRATTEELSAADMESKIQQAAAQVERLSTWEEKKQWAEEQRQYGNQLYREERYEQAIDIYLTCLVVAQQEKKLAPDTDVKSVGLVFLYVMNNLAQSTLALKWFRKTELFCTLALEEVNINMALEEVNISMEDVAVHDDEDSGVSDGTRSASIGHQQQQQQQHQKPHQIAKLYYKRGKARRLRGLYKDARVDLETALQWIDRVNTSSILENNQEKEEGQSLAASRRVLERELQLVAKASAEARRNKERQQQAMQKVLGSTSTSKQGLPVESSGTDTSVELAASLFPPEGKSKRAFSNLRAPSKQNNDIQGSSEDSRGRELDGDQRELTYSQWYLVMIGRVAQKLLEWTGDEEYAKRPKED
jgi:tetratricopeptide (TPR) repeat protein